MNLVEDEVWKKSPCMGIIAILGCNQHGCMCTSSAFQSNSCQFYEGVCGEVAKNNTTFFVFFFSHLELKSW